MQVLSLSNVVSVARTVRSEIAYRALVIQDPAHKKEVGKRLQEAREAAGLTQDAAGRTFEKVTESAVGKATVSGWERGANYPDLFVLSHLVKEYKTTADKILFGDRALSPRIIDLAHRIEAIKDPALRRYTFANVESLIVNAEENRGRTVLASPEPPKDAPAPSEAPAPSQRRGPARGIEGE